MECGVLLSFVAPDMQSACGSQALLGGQVDSMNNEILGGVVVPVAKFSPTERIKEKEQT